MTQTQERAISLALNILHTGFFECPKQYYEYFVNNDEWALLMAAGGIESTDIPPMELAVAVMHKAVVREGFFSGMADFKPPAHYCSFLRESISRGERTIHLKQCEEGQSTCPYATFENIRDSRRQPAHR